MKRGSSRKDASLGSISRYVLLDASTRRENGRASIGETTRHSQPHSSTGPRDECNLSIQVGLDRFVFPVVSCVATSSFGAWQRQGALVRSGPATNPR